MNPLTIFPDPRLVALRIIRATPITLLKAGTVLPEDRPKGQQGLPYAMVSHDGGDVRHNAKAIARIRVTVWDKAEDKTLRLAQVLRAYMLAARGDAELGGCGNATLPLPAPDPDSGAPMASFLLDVRLNPITLPEE